MARLRLADERRGAAGRLAAPAERLATSAAARRGGRRHGAFLRAPQEQRRAIS